MCTPFIMCKVDSSIIVLVLVLVYSIIVLKLVFESDYNTVSDSDESKIELLRELLRVVSVAFSWYLVAAVGWNQGSQRVEHHQQVEKIRHHSVITKNTMSLQNWWEDKYFFVTLVTLFVFVLHLKFAGYCIKKKRSDDLFWLKFYITKLF